MTYRAWCLLGVLLAGVLLDGVLTRAGELRITAPPEGAVVTGAVTFTAAVHELPALAAVEWRLNGRSISGSLMTPPVFAQPWHPAQVFDGPMTLVAVGRDITGKEVARSLPVRFTADTGPGDIRLDAPVDLSKPLSGTVDFTVTAIRPLTPAERKAREDNPKFDKSQMNKTVECLQFFVDGVLMARQFGAPTRTLKLDTTRLPDGPHELQVSAYAWFSGVPPIGMLQTTFTTANGHTPMAILTRCAVLCLQPGNSADLAPSLVYTDGTTEPLKAIPTYESTAPAVATVNAQGRVQAVGKGMAVIKLSVPSSGQAPYAAETRVVVGLPDGIPHFARNGRLLLKYDPKQSVFVRSMFSLNPKMVLDTPGLAPLVKDAGVNTCESGFFHNPNDGSHTDSLEKYVKNWNPWFASNLATPAKALGMGLILSGDDWVRTTNELKWTATTPWALDLAKHIWTTLRDSNTVTAVEMMDEASFLGSGPAPTDGHWAKNDPAIHDKTLVNLIEAIHSVEHNTPISWPVLGLAGPDSAGAWMGDPRYADYASQYWTTMDWRLAYPWAMSGPQLKSDLERVMVGRFPKMQWDRPQLMLISGCGPFYTKRVEGDHFQPGLDEGAPNETPATLIAAQPLYAAISGAAGVRMYSVDFWWKQERTKAKIGSRELQTGASPFGAGSDRWHALAAAYTTLATLEPHLLQPQADAPALGPDFTTAARRGPNGNLFMALNWSQESRTPLVPLGKSTARVVRYHVRGGSAWVNYTTSQAAPVTFAPGEFMAWLITPAGKTDTTPPAVRLVLPYEPTIAGPLTLTADAGDDKGLKQVEFFVNGTSIGVATRAPYTVTWDAATPLKGEWHGVKAVATDTAGNTSEARAMVRVAP
jgi:hypothetical protein